MLVRNSFELGALCHKTRVLLLELTLLVHHLGDLIADHLGHFFAHVGLKQVQVAQRLVSLKRRMGGLGQVEDCEMGECRVLVRTPSRTMEIL